jgi:Trk-type K+ transport system membrane component
MTLYSLVLFLHVASALALAAGLTIDALVLFQLRTGSPSETQPWLTLWSPVPRSAGISGLFLLLSGGYLTHRMSAWSLAWPKVALAALILLGILGGIASRRINALRGIGSNGQAGEAEYRRRLQDPMLMVSLCTRIALLFAAVLLMNAKPDLLQSLVVIGGAVVSGLAAAFILPSREPQIRMRAAD